MGGFPLAGIRALVVDDDEDAREIAAALLLGAGAEVMVASSSAEAIAMMMSGRPTVVVTDMSMPNGTGAEVLAAGREILGFRLACVLVTAFVGDEHRNRAAVLGFDAYLEKPFQAGQLVNTVVEAVARSTQRSGAQSGVKSRPPALRRRRLKQSG
jgi:CheY-like chemotaxis protein